MDINMASSVLSDRLCEAGIEPVAALNLSAAFGRPVLEIFGRGIIGIVFTFSEVMGGPHDGRKVLVFNVFNNLGNYVGGGHILI